MKDSNAFLTEYLHSVENEICNDLRAYELNFAQAKDYSYLPRPNKWISVYKNRQKSIRIAGIFLFYFWLFGGAIFYFAYEMVINWIYSIRIPDRKNEILNINEFALGFSERSFKVINKESLGRAPQAWIVLPWVDIQCDPQRNIFSLYSLLNFGDYVQAWLLSVRSLILLYTSESTSSSLLQGYTAYRWFLTRLGFAKFKHGHFITAEHFDRWILMIDSMIHQLKMDGVHQVSLTVVQHGALDDLSSMATVADSLKINLKWVDSRLS